MSIELAKKLLGKETKVFDYRGYFGGKYMDNIDDVKE
jgi:hypothetical protein